MPRPVGQICQCALLAATLLAQSPEDQIRQASDLLQRNSAASAVPLLEKLLMEFPQNLKARNLLGIALSSLGRRAEANQHFQDALQVDPNFVPALKNLAANELVLGQRKSARMHFEAAVKRAPSDPVANLALAEMAFEDKRFADAAGYYQRGGELVYRDPSVALRYAAASIELIRPQEAALVIDSIGPDADSKTQFTAGLLLTRVERYQEAAKRFELAEPGHSDPYMAGYNAALALVRGGKYDEAIRTCARLLSHGQRKAELLNLMAQAHEKSGRTREAYDSLREATTIDPRDETNYLDLIALCLEHQNYDLGVEIADVGLKWIPQSHRLHLQRGIVYSMKGHIDAAEKEFARASELAPAGVNLALVSHGMVLMQLDRTGEAIELFRARRQSQPNDYLVNWFLAEALIKQGAAAGSPAENEAVEAAAASIRAKPDVLQTHVLLGKLLFKRGDLKTAAHHLETAYRLDPKDTSAAYQLAVLYRKQGDRKRADELFARVGQAKSQELDPASAQVLMRIVREGSK